MGMRNKPFFVLLVASLSAALTFTAVGRGWGDPVEDRPAPRQPHGPVVALDSSLSDAQGDVFELSLYPAPNPGRDLTIEGNTAKVLVPRWVVGYPQSFQWVGGTIQLQDQERLDLAPDMKVLNWTRGATTEAPDIQDPQLLPHEDLTYVRLRELEGSRLEFFWRCRGDIPMDALDVGYGAFIGQDLTSGPDYAVVLAPTEAGWIWTVSALSETGFPWHTAGYEDILSASVSQTGDGQLTFEMTAAQDIPALPAEGDGNPGFSWMLLQDGDDTVGALGDLGVAVRWDAEASQWSGAVLSWDGQDYTELDIPVEITRIDSTLSATVDAADLGLVGSFSWRVMTGVYVGPEEELFLGLVDQAPESGWVDDIVAPTPTPIPTATATATPPGPGLIYLPLISRGVAL